MITRTETRKSSAGSKKGWCFDVYYGASYPNFVSALYKTKREAEAAKTVYLTTGKFDWYGSAEKKQEKP